MISRDESEDLLNRLKAAGFRGGGAIAWVDSVSVVEKWFAEMMKKQKGQ
ncbi:hypothetical protein N9937_00730 [bacterium]|nr:hypothetical protein [bacterium]